ncbi:hypothetical protein NLU13_3043 [Sarocladium strictum]|uniref:Uncharacterized protein n=1 Tax=Sarocladium strictum TaxID=5046 RepID=A0AA39GL95_SARSR|nr:hypothetical protein NLU13_3043 [Sarocladium strictum]
MPQHHHPYNAPRLCLPLHPASHLPCHLSQPVLHAASQSDGNLLTSLGAVNHSPTPAIASGPAGRNSTSLSRELQPLVAHTLSWNHSHTRSNHLLADLAFNGRVTSSELHHLPTLSSVMQSSVSVGASLCALLLGFGLPVSTAQVMENAAAMRPVVHFARAADQREEHIHVDIDGIVSVPITTLYSVSTPMVTETSTSTEIIVPKTSSEGPECSPSVVTKLVTVTKQAPVTVEPESTSESVEYSTVTEIHTAVSTIVMTLTDSAAVTVIETPIEAASGKDGISYSAPASATPVSTTTTWSTVTSGEPTTSTSFVVVTAHTPVTSPGGINATVIVYPPGGDPQPTPSDIPVIVGAASEPQHGFSGAVFAAVAAVGAVMCFF